MRQPDHTRCAVCGKKLPQKIIYYAQVGQIETTKERLDGAVDSNCTVDLFWTLCGPCHDNLNFRAVKRPSPKTPTRRKRP